MKVIAFTGAQNGGKTTMMNELGKTLSEKHKVRVGYILPSDDQSISRRSKRLGFTINENTNFESQYHITLSYLAVDMETRKFAELNGYDYLIFDRSMWDILPYSHRVMTMAEYGRIQDMITFHVEKYPIDHLIYCDPVNFDADGHRSTDPSFRSDIISRFNTIVGDKITGRLQNVSVEERLKQMLGMLNV